MADEEQDPMWGTGACGACGRKIPYGHLMCRPHWNRVPPYLRRAVYAVLEGWEKEAVTLDALREVQKEAIEAATKS